MPDTTELLAQFRGVFGENGGDFYPGNIGVSRTARDICQDIMRLPDPELFDYFAAWNDHKEDARKPLSVAYWLVNNGQWEGAWALAQLHYDQVLKQEAKTKKRLHKGHPLCNLAIIGREIGSPALNYQCIHDGGGESRRRFCFALSGLSGGRREPRATRWAMPHRSALG